MKHGIRLLYFFAIVMVSMYISCEPDDSLAINPSTNDIRAEGQVISIDVRSNTDWTVSANADWISFEPAGGRRNEIVTATVTANLTGEERQATAVFRTSGRREGFIVRQATSDNVFENLNLTYAGDHISRSGGEMEITVTSNATWTAASDSEWAVVEPGNGNGSGVVKVTVSPNGTGTERTAVIAVTGVTVRRTAEITQDAE